jgi:hypothetical protein
MSSFPGRFLAVVLIVGIFLSGCNLPSNVAAPEISAEDIASTAVAGVFTQQAAAAPSAPAAPAAAAGAVPQAVSQCNPTVTAITDANVRSGPSTDYGIVGNLPLGGVAPIAGRNDLMTWWFIQFAGGPGGYAWIAGSVVSTSCLPAVVQVVAAPPLPAAPPPDQPSSTPTLNGFIPPLFDFPLFLLASPTPTFDFSVLNPDLNLPDFDIFGP